MCSSRTQMPSPPSSRSVSTWKTCRLWLTSLPPCFLPRSFVGTSRITTTLTIVRVILKKWLSSRPWYLICASRRALRTTWNAGRKSCWWLTACMASFRSLASLARGGLKKSNRWWTCNSKIRYYALSGRSSRNCLPKWSGSGLRSRKSGMRYLLSAHLSHTWGRFLISRLGRLKNEWYPSRSTWNS